MLQPTATHTRSNPLAPPAATTLADLVPLYDAFFVDQFGVLHDGTRAYTGAIEALELLKASGKPVILLSNSGRTAEFNAERMDRLGFAASLYTAFVTSGDVAIAILKSGQLKLNVAGTVRCLTVSGTDDRNLVEAMGYIAVDAAREADLIVISGSRGHEVALDEYREMFGPAARRNVPAICTNPDRIMLTTRGVAYGAGRIAALYESMGGQVTWVGKPKRDIYDFALKSIAHCPIDRILCIGDSVEHDVVGARAFGAKVALTRTGILADYSDVQLADEMTEHAVIPDWIIPAFA